MVGHPWGQPVALGPVLSPPGCCRFGIPPCCPPRRSLSSLDWLKPPKEKLAVALVQRCLAALTNAGELAFVPLHLLVMLAFSPVARAAMRACTPHSTPALTSRRLRLCEVPPVTASG